MRPACARSKSCEQDLKPSDILTRKAFENAIVANSAIGGSTNAPIHINAIARHVGVKLAIEDWEKIGYDVPLLVNMQPAGKYLGEEYYRAGGLPAVMHELLQSQAHPCRCADDQRQDHGRECQARTQRKDADVIKPYSEPMKKQAGFKVFKGNLFDSAIMKTSVISDEFRRRYLSNPKDPNAFEGRAMVFEGPEDYHHRIDDPKLKIDEHTLLFMRGVGADRLSRLGRSREHAAAGGADQTRHHLAALHRRRPAVRHVGLAVDPQRLAGSGGQRRACHAEDRRPRAHRSRARALPTS